MKFKVLPKINPVCRFVVWIVELSPHHTTNPMTKQSALKMVKSLKNQGKYAELVKAYSCVSAKNLEN